METVARFLEIDRHAGLGRLGGGVVHALNNVFAAFLGQLDLLMFNPDTAPFRGELEKMLTSCEEGTELTRSLMMVTNSLQNDEAVSAGDLVAALLRILKRVFRRQEIQVVSKIESTGYLHDVSHFAQAAFHVVLLGFIVESRIQQNDRKLTCTVRQQDSGVQLVVKVGLGSFEKPAVESLEMDYPPESSEDDYHFWIIDKLCHSGGNWSSADDKSELALLWKT